MAKASLPKYIDPIQLTEKGMLLKGKLKLSEMKRLSELLAENQGFASIELAFRRDEDRNIGTICGKIRTGLKMICQRCLEPFTLELEAKVLLGIVSSEAAAKQLPNDYDPLLITEEPVSLATMIEDELLLGIPIIPRHSIKECPVKSEDLLELEESPAVEEENPFKVLKKLMSGDK